MTELSPGHAAAALAGVDQTAAAVRQHSGWAGRAFTAYAIGTVVFFPASGLLPTLLVNVAWAVFLVSLFAWTRPHRVIGRGFRRLYLVSAVTWTVLWVGLTVLGHLAFAGNIAYWLLTGMVVATPMAVAATRSRS